MYEPLGGRTCLILGAAGFIGRHLVASLAREGAKLRLYGRGVEKVSGANIEARFEADFGEHSLLKTALQGVDIVFHLINTTSPATAASDPEFDISSNLINSIRLLSLCHDAGVDRVIFASSGGTVYGPVCNSPISEKALPSPVSSYGITKSTLEKYLYLYNFSYGMRNIVLRISNPYGPYQLGKKKQGVIGHFMRAAASGKPVVVWGREAVRDYVYIEDVASAFVAAARYEGKEHIFNVGTGVGRTLGDVINDIEAVAEVTLQKDIRPPRPFDVATNVLDVRAAQRELGWEASADWHRSLARTWEWVRQTSPD